MIARVDHIALAVNDLEKAIDHAKLFGGKYLFTQEVEKEGYKVAGVALGEMILTLMQPVTEDSWVRKYIDKNGEGLNHLGIEVDNVEEYAKELESKGIKVPVKLLDGDANNGRKEVLVSPKDGYGYVWQLIEWPEGSNTTPEHRIERLTDYRT